MKLIDFGFGQVINVKPSVDIYFNGRLVPPVPKLDTDEFKIHSMELVSLGTHSLVEINGIEMHFKDNLVPVFKHSQLRSLFMC